MSNGFQFIDIILFAMIAAFLIMRLRNVLGRRDGHEGNYRDSYNGDASEQNDASTSDGNIDTDIDGNDNLAQLTDHANDIEAASNSNRITEENDNEPKVSGLIDLQNAHPSFNLEEFLAGARVAFEMVLGAYATGDRKVLENLLSSEVFGNFVRAIDERENLGHTLEDTLVGISKSEILDANTDNGRVMVTVKFMSEQINVVRDAEGQIASGNPNEVVDAVDFWTFARDIQATNPNWTLVATRSLD
ncbi:MAG: hypothetical protein CBB68_08405 [Rhodospirillaceae bacterium TMED8]|nr:translocase [Magnetovibrio sp.]OUT50392.1 MAG: hypothetical protein CBB68_08405 [Rhodospirillaceae bacterium TMED8]